MKQLVRAVIASWFAIVFALVALAPALASDAATPAVGDQSGQRFSLKCPTGRAFEGFAYAGTNGWTFLSVFCQPVTEGILAGFPSEGQSVGSSAGGKAPDSSCNLYDPSTVITALSVYLGPQGFVHQVRAICHDLSGQKGGVLLAATDIADSGTAQPSGPHKQAHCDAGGYAVGLIGTYDGIVNSLGLICHQPGDEASHSGTQGTTANTTPSVPSNEPPSNDPAGSVAAAVATTIYSRPAGSEIGYLGAGDAVTIVSCNDIGWCKISAPEKGYVWGLDLSR